MPERSAARLWAMIGLLALGMLIAFVERVDLSVALASPEFQRQFSIDDSGRGLVSSAFFLSYAVLQVPAGWLADRTRPKYLYAAAVLAWSIFTIGTGLTVNLYQLLAARLLLGCAESVLTPVTMLWIRSCCSEEQRGTAIGISQAGAKLGPAVGLPLSAWLIAMGGWRFLFVAVGMGSLLWLVLWWAIAPAEIPSRMNKELPPLDAGPVRDSIYANPLLWGVMTGTFCYQYFFYFCVTWMPAYLMERQHVSLSSMGWYSALSFGGMAALAVSAGWAADRLILSGRNALAVRKHFAMAGLLFAATEVIGVWSSSRGVALFFVVLSLCGLGLATANHWALTQTVFPPHLIGRATGMQALAASLPGVLAPLTTGWLKQSTGSFDGPVELTLLLLVIGLAAYLLAVREKFASRS